VAQAIEMFFDDQADADVRQLWHLLADAGLPSLATFSHRRHRPHVSLTGTESFDGVDLSEVRQVLGDCHLDLDLHALARFPTQQGVLFLGVVVTAPLLALHERVHETLRGQSITHWPYYVPGRWVPHCTLARGMDGDSMAAAVRLLHGVAPISAKVASVGVTDTTTGDITPLTS
jgi:2'-5' RNA ligase